MKNTILYSLVLGLPWFTSCSDQKMRGGTNQSELSENPSATLQAVIDASVTDEAVDIHDVRSKVQPGDEVTLRGQVIGNLHPFVEGRAAFILGDPNVLTACNEIPGDSCETPWDVCCDTVEDRKRGTATIQVLGEDGRVLKEPLEGVGGIEKLSNLLVSGVVAEGSSAALLVLNAKAIDVVE